MRISFQPMFNRYMDTTGAIPGRCGLLRCQSEWAEILREVAVEAFETMVGVTVTVSKDVEALILAEVTGMVGIAGQVCAVFSMRCSLKAATLLSSQMLGVSLEEAEAQRTDAVGEMCNIIAGSFKAKAGMGETCVLSIPMVLAGTNFQIHSTRRTWSLGLPLYYEGEPIWIALNIKV